MTSDGYISPCVAQIEQCLVPSAVRVVICCIWISFPPPCPPQRRSAQAAPCRAGAKPSIQGPGERRTVALRGIAAVSVDHDCSFLHSGHLEGVLLFRASVQQQDGV